MDYNERTYRLTHVAGGSRRAFVVEYKSTDLWIAVDRDSFSERMCNFAYETIVALRQRMEEYLVSDGAYQSSLVPYAPREDAPGILIEMSQASAKAGIGPMSAVAGACARYVAQRLMAEFGCKEVIVENGGDIYADVVHDLDIAIFAGESPLSERVGVTIPAEMSPVGVCTSSGTVGPSLSFGRADAVMVVCRDVALADSFATAFANEVKCVADVDRVIEMINSRDEIVSAMVVKEDRLGFTGELDLKLFSPQK